MRKVWAPAQEMLTAKQEASGEVQRVYVHEGRGLVESARILKCSPPALARWLDDHGYERRDVATAQDLRRQREEVSHRELTEKIVELHRKGMTLSRIADETEASQSKVWYILNKEGLTRKYASSRNDGGENGAVQPDPGILATLKRRQKKLIQERRRLVVDMHTETGWTITRIGRKLHESQAFVRETLGLHGLVVAASSEVSDTSDTEEQIANI